MSDRAHRNAILAKERGWRYGNWCESTGGIPVMVSGWIPPDGCSMSAQRNAPNMHSFDVLAEVLRGMTEEEREKVVYLIRETYHEAFLNGKAERWTELGWVLLVMTPDDLAEAICQVVEER